MSTFIGNFTVLAVAVLCLSVWAADAFEQAERPAVVADSGWGPNQLKTTPSSSFDMHATTALVN
ncbi:hypothetical protein [Streptomyces sp. NPDC050416]|uniref:hypothetical protein n=1 Tax=Streptomyces sp. NPDC050416 TaxID=3365611 RepID=UPI0037988899